MTENRHTPWKRYLLLGALAMAFGQVGYSVFLNSVEPNAPDLAGGVERLTMALMSLLGTVGTALGSVLYARSAPGISRRGQVPRGRKQQFLVEFIATVGLVFATTFLGWALLGLFTVTGDSSLPSWERVVAIPLAIFGSLAILTGVLLWHLWLRRTDDPFSPISVVRELRSLPVWKWLARPAEQWDPAARRDVWTMRIFFWSGLFIRSIGAAFLGGYLTENLSGRPLEDILAILALTGVVAVGGLLVALPAEVLPGRGISRARKLLEAALDNGLIVLGGGFLGALIAVIATQEAPLYGLAILAIYGAVVFGITGWFNSSLLAYRSWHDPEVQRRKNGTIPHDEEDAAS